ncbi:MAG: hypothetical protein HOC23_21370 [Halieaceae bacterium]|nr:hypothetical protein [Halieaceae bacterium]
MSKVFTGYLLIAICLLSPGIHAESQNPGLDTIVNLQQHADNIYSAGQPAQGLFTEFAKQGVTDVINLRSHEEMKTLAEEAEVLEAGMRYHHISIAGPGDLNRDNAMQFDQLLSQAGNENTLIHCKSSNRVGALMALRAAWLQNKNGDEALAVGKQYGLSSLEPVVRKILNP